MAADVNELGMVIIRYQYMILSSHSLEYFNEELNVKIREGWDIDGNLNVTSIGSSHSPLAVLYSQRLVKEDE